MNVEQNRESKGIVSGQKIMDPGACSKLDVNDASVSDEKTDGEVSVGRSNNAEVMSKTHHDNEPQLTKLNLGKQASRDGAEDVVERSCSQSWEPKSEEQEVVAADQIPLRKARVSVRARSEAPLVSNYFHFTLSLFMLVIFNVIFLLISLLHEN